MTHVKHLQRLMRDIGPQLDLEEVVEFEQDNLWTLAFDEQTVVTVVYDETSDKLVLESVIGHLPQDRGERLLLRLLQHGFDREQSGGSRAALNAPDGEALLLMELPANIDLTQLQESVTGLQRQVLHWRTSFESAGKKSESQPFHAHAAQDQ